MTITRRLDETGPAASTGEAISVIYLVRHGDRFDYANPTWVENAKEAGNLPTDPPLSALGHRQARETAKHLRASTTALGPMPGVSKILVSPFLRVIQTACPASEEFGVPLLVEEGLSEAHHTPGGVLPSPSQRFAYFPQVDPKRRSLIEVKATPGFKCRKTGYACEAFAGHYVKRMEAVASRFEEEFRGETIICFSHAASVALVAALLRCSLRDLKFAPCGVFALRRVGDGPWQLAEDGGSNPHVSENSPTTYPWGFGEKHFKERDGSRYQGSSEGIGLDYFFHP